jgi:hypothetical protein
MKPIAAVLLSLLAPVWLQAQSDDNPPAGCERPVAQLTSQLNLSTGINHFTQPETLYGCGYGGNSFYTTPNNNYDQFWKISTLPPDYTTRSAIPFTYTGAFLQTGDHPFIVCVNNNPLQGWLAYFGADQQCYNPNSTNAAGAQWLSVYSDAGGQSPDITSGTFSLQRCFSLCSSDSVTLSLSGMADDLITAVYLDQTQVFNNSSSICCQFSCDKVISISHVASLSAGPHQLRVDFKDTNYGHLGMIVMASISSTSNKNSLIKASEDELCGFITRPATGIRTSTKEKGSQVWPSLSSGSFRVEVPAGAGGSLLRCFSTTGQLVWQQETNQAVTPVQLDVADGQYLLHITNNLGTQTQRITIRK